MLHLETLSGNMIDCSENYVTTCDINTNSLLWHETFEIIKKENQTLILIRIQKLKTTRFTAVTNISQEVTYSLPPLYCMPLGKKTARSELPLLQNIIYYSF